MKPTVYLETTIASYLTARPSNDPEIAGMISATNKWWVQFRNDFDLYESELVLLESSAGDPDAARRRLEFLADLPLLVTPDAAQDIASALLVRAALPAKAKADALHVAICAVHGIQYLLTWNCRHLANATLRLGIEHVCREHGYEPPIVCTPAELSEVS